MRFASLGSGSAGNALVVEAKQTHVLLDCGFSVRETTRRLARLALDPSRLSAIVVTHEHSDHVSGVFKLAARHHLAIYLTHGTLSATRHAMPNSSLDIRIIDAQSIFEIDDVRVETFPVPHDAREPVQFTFCDGNRRLGVLTDAGMTTQYMEDKLSGCDALVLECNHDADMLMSGSYPWPLKQRISGRYGHLDNAAAAAFLGRLNNGRLQHIVAAHLSEKNNKPELARKALGAAINAAQEWVGVADQKTGFSWRQII